MKHILTLLVVLMMLTTPVLAAGEKLANGTVEDFATYDKVLTEKEMQNVTLSKAIDNAPAELAGKIKADSLKASEIKITKDSRGLVMSADLPKGQDEVEITLTPDAIAEIPNCDGEVFYVHRFDDDGNYVSVQEVKVNKKGDTKYVTKFSENILNGFSGYYQVTQTLESGQYLTLPAGAERVYVSVGGEVPEYVVFDELDVDTWPVNLSVLYPFNGNSSALVGQDGIDTSVSHQADHAFFTGSNSFVNIGQQVNYSNGFSVYLDFNTSAYSESAKRYAALISNSELTDTNGFTVSYLDRQVDNKMTFYFGSIVGSVKATPNYQFADETRYKILCTYNASTSTMKFYIVGSDVTATKTSASYVSNVDSTRIGRGYTGGTPEYRGKIYTTALWNRALESTDFNILNNGFSGIQLANTPYHGGTLTLPPTTSVQYVATDGIAREVTARAFFTEDTTLISDTQTAEYQNISIVHTAGNNTTSGQIVYAFNTTYQGTPTLESNNTVATVSKNTTHVTIATGELMEGQTFYYNVSIPRASSGSPVNPSFAEPAGIFVAIAGAFAAGVGYFANRRRM